MAIVNVKKFTYRAVIQSSTPLQYTKVENKTTYNEGTKLYTTTIILQTKTGNEYKGVGISDNTAGSMQAADDDAFNKLNKDSSGTIVVSTYGDDMYIREDKYASPIYTLETAVNQAKGTAEAFGVFDMNYDNQYLLERQPVEPTPPPAPEAPSPSPREMYIPATRVEEPKSTSGGEFIVKSTGEPYKGFYVKSFKNKYYSGKSPENLGAEIIKVKTTPDNLSGTLSSNLLTILLELAKGVFNRKPTASEKKAGTMKRYFVKDKNTSKINETTQDIYQQAKQLPNRLFAEMNWTIKGPANDIDFNGITYLGAESKNRQAVLKLEKTLPGISNYIQQYNYLVEATPKTQVLAGTVEGSNYGTNAAIGPQQNTKSTKTLEEEAIQQSKNLSYLTDTPERTDKRRLTSQIISEKDSTVVLQNSRKANFDTKE